MRMRKKKHGAERIAACSALLISDPSDIPNGLDRIFEVSQPIHLEIGCGKGDFAVGMAQKYPHINFIAMERVSDVCCVALEKAMAVKETQPLDNLRFLIGDAQTLSDLFPAHSLDCIYLNFSDPWPKAGHAKRRLTHRNFLTSYHRLLRQDGLLRFKTDNVGLFEFSLEEFAAYGAKVIWQTRDLHQSEKNSDNVTTEYERNFSAKGFSICSAWVQFPESDSEKE